MSIDRIASIAERLWFSAEEDFLRLWRSYRDGTFKIVPGPMERHFAIARSKPSAFMTHPPVLGVSVGGTYTKVIVAERVRGRLVVHHLAAFANPDRATPMEDCWDRFLLEDPAVRSYLASERRPLIGFSVPVPMLKDGVFFHISKVPGIQGLIARDLERDAPTHHLGNNLRRYFSRRAIAEPLLFYYSDTVIAHHGGMSTSVLDPDDKSILLVSGTGLGTCDEGNFVLTGRAPILVDDEELFPREETEGYQYQFLGAGRGLYSVMRRACTIAAGSPQSALSGCSFDTYFATTRDSRTVSDIARAVTGDGTETPVVRELRSRVGTAGMEELCVIASLLLDRVVSAIANSGVFTTVHMGPARSGRGHVFFFEGSIATAPALLPRIKAEMRRMIAQNDLFLRIGREQPPQPVMEAEYFPVEYDAGVPTDQIDLSATGVVTATIAQNLIEKGIA
ncbi:MAG: hypothetical protein EA383_02625 [Spirochaetaceae bacterium]|nr:MAG: hypothetical protein EA383_02625 [Spirochaetaceae bacterium]